MRAMAARLLALALGLGLIVSCRTAPDQPPPPRAPAPVSVAPPGPPPIVMPAAAPSREPDGTIHSTLASWRCANAICSSGAWTGAVVSWPAGTAHHGNGRKGNAGRDVFSAGGRALYPYMGPWATGCEITAISGAVDVVEFQHGADTWRTTHLKPGQSHTIQLVPPEDSALLEGPEGVPAFSVTAKNCTPQPLP